MTTTVAELQTKRDALDAERCDLAQRDDGNPAYDEPARRTARRLEQLGAETAALDAQLRDACQRMSVAELTAHRAGVAAALAAAQAAVPGLMGAAARDSTAQPALTVGIRRAQSLAESLGSLDRFIAARRQEHGVDLARAWSTDGATAALYQAAVEREAAALDHVAALAAAYEAAIRAGAGASSMPPMAQGGLAKLRELTAWIAGLRRFGVKIDTSRLPAAIRAYLEGQ